MNLRSWFEQPYTKVVPERCTCGAILPEDARFCHKCGKPQYEEDIAREQQQAMPVIAQGPIVPPDVSPAAAPVRIDFRNSRAVLVSLLFAALALFCMMLTSAIAPGVIPVLFGVAGFAAAAFYNRGAVQKLSAVSGARLGWMTGFWVFVVIAALAALITIMDTDPNMRKQFMQMPQYADNPNVQEMIKILEQPKQFALKAVLILVQMFFMLPLITALGGLLGAKLTTPGPRA